MSFTDTFATPDDTGPLRSSELRASFGESLAAQAAETLDPESGLSGFQLLRRARRAIAGGDVVGGLDPTGMSADTLAQTQDALAAAKNNIADTPIEDAKARVRQAGLDRDLHLPDQPSIKSPVLDLMIDEARTHRDRRAAIARGPQGFMPDALGVGTSLLAGAIDPVNIAASFVPVLGEARWGQLMAAAGDSVVRRAGARALGGAVQGAVGNALLTPAEYALRSTDNKDYTFADALHSVIFGASVGAFLHAGPGLIGDVRRRRRGLSLVTRVPDDVADAAPAGSHVLPESAFSPEGATAGRADLVHAPDPVGALDDLPPRAREDTLRAAIADLVGGHPVRAGELLDGAAMTDPRIAASFEAFHGSPHDFDRFSSSMIGTGEGNQSFGHGFYFAEQPDVARTYIRSTHDAAQPPAGTAEFEEWLNAETPPGQIYRVKINADRDHFLDWDKPLSAQSPAVREALARVGIKSERDLADVAAESGVIGPDFDPASAPLGPILKGHSAAADEHSRPRFEQLRDAGIPGIKYLDQGSRGAGEGTHNFVVFDDSLINITHKNGEPVAQRELPGHAHALSADARNWPELPAGARIVADGQNGPVLHGLEDRWSDAVAWLRQAQTGDAVGVLSHPAVGRIDVIWGDAMHGLQHIIEKHPEVVDRLPGLLVGMREVESPARGRVRLEGGGYAAAISREYDGVAKHWLLTAFELRRGGEEGGPGGPSGFRPTADLQAPLSRYYGGEAGPDRNIGRVPASEKAAWDRLTERPSELDDAAALERSQRADSLPQPPSVNAEPSARRAAAERALAEAEADYKANEPYLPEEVKVQLERNLKTLDIETADREHVLSRGAACLAAAVA